MALDEPQDDDKVVKDDGITFIINQTLFDQVKPVNVDYVESAMGSGFSIRSNLARGCGSSCGTSCSC